MHGHWGQYQLQCHWSASICQSTSLFLPSNSSPGFSQLPHPHRLTACLSIWVGLLNFSGSPGSNFSLVNFSGSLGSNFSLVCSALSVVYSFISLYSSRAQRNHPSKRRKEGREKGRVGREGGREGPDCKLKALQRNEALLIYENCLAG